MPCTDAQVADAPAGVGVHPLDHPLALVPRDHRGDPGLDEAVVRANAAWDPMGFAVTPTAGSSDILAPTGREESNGSAATAASPR